MKQTFKKLMAVLLATIMTLTMVTSVFAASQTSSSGSLTVKVTEGKSLEGQTIYIYKLFALTPASEGTEFTYEVNPNYKTQLVAALNKVITPSKITDESTDIELYDAVKDSVGDDKIQEFANEFTKAVVTTNEKKPEPTQKSNAISDNTTSYTFQNVEYGYYLVYQTGTQAFQSSLANVKDEKNTVNLKGETPGITKQADKTTTSIGDVVTYTITGTIPDTTGFEKYTYIIHDTLSEGLDFVENENGTSVANPKAYPVTITITGGNSITQNAALKDEGNRIMELDLSEWVKLNQTDNVGKTFTVKYYAKVNDKAVVINTQNKAELEYSNNPYDETSKVTTPPEIEKTPTFPLDINKIDGTNENLLAGAKFKIFKENNSKPESYDENDPIKVKRVNDGSYIVADSQEQPEAIAEMETVSSAISGNINLKLNGLAEGVYYLEETKAPNGYNKLEKAIKVTITRTDKGEGEVQYTVSKDDAPEDDKIIDVENNSGSLLPETGGMNTVIFTVVAVILILGVAISFVRSRKTEKK